MPTMQNQEMTKQIDDIQNEKGKIKNKKLTKTK
jgi:hypothetical protein